MTLTLRAVNDDSTDITTLTLFDDGEFEYVTGHDVSQCTSDICIWFGKWNLEQNTLILTYEEFFDEYIQPIIIRTDIEDVNSNIWKLSNSLNPNTNIKGYSKGSSTDHFVFELIKKKYY